MEYEAFFRKKCEFKIGANVPGHFPDSIYPEVAFLGRSNVGKSSIINALLNHRIARTSQAPGRTQQINFFLLAESIYLVDMPGYGYASVSKASRANLNRLIYSYLSSQENLVRLFLLIDARHGIKPIDKAILDMLQDNPVTVQIILTKIDKLNKAEKLQVMEETEKVINFYGFLHPNILSTSSKEKSGLDSLKQEIFQISTSRK